MTERDADIEFDFFEEPETREAARPERPAQPRPSGQRRPPAGPPAGLTPLLRLVGLVAFAIVVVVLLIYAAKGCASSSKHSKYQGYMSKISQVAGSSQRVGRDLNTVLTTPGLKPQVVLTRLAGLARREQQDAAQARGIDPPGRLRDQHKFLIEALDFRASGLAALTDAFRKALGNRNRSGNGLLLSVPAQRLLASDVVWDDSFKDSAKQVLRAQGVGDVTVPDSDFLPNAEFVSPRSFAAVLQRVGGTTTAVRGGGPHGVALVSVTVLPKGTVLSTSAENTVVATTDLAFSVAVLDSGKSLELNVPVTLTIQQTPTPIVKRTTIDIIQPNEQKKATITNIGAVQFTRPVHVKVFVGPVPGEQYLANNSAVYPVIFSTTPP